VSREWYFEMQSRLLVAWFKQLADQLGNKENIPSEVLEEQMFRLTVGVVMLLRRHQVNKRGQCKYCGWTRWKWRLWRRRPQCTVHGGLCETPCYHDQKMESSQVSDAIAELVSGFRISLTVYGALGFASGQPLARISAQAVRRNLLWRGMLADLGRSDGWSRPTPRILR
jgi:hypothetical protein